MTTAEIRLTTLILEEHFGAIVAKVGTHLVRHGFTPLRLLCHQAGLPLDEVKKAVATLIQHNVVTFAFNAKKKVAEYRADFQHVLLRVRIPRYIIIAKTLYGDMGELIVEELLYNGQAAMSEVIDRVTKRMSEALEVETVATSQVKDTFENLIKTHFIQRCPSPAPDIDDDCVVPTLKSNDDDLFRVPVVTASKSARAAATKSAKRQRIESESDEEDESVATDKSILWQVNFDRFHEFLRDVLIIRSLSRRVDPTAGEIVRTMLRLSELTTATTAGATMPISGNQIFQNVPKANALTKSVFDEYMTVLVDDSSKIVRKCGDSGGGMYSIDIDNALVALSRATIESIVQERFGSKCMRIFRILLLKSYLEQKQVEEFAMIPPKEAKELLYKLFTENLIHLQEIPRTPDYAPSRTIYLFGVNTNSVVRMLLDRCLKAVGNSMLRRKFEKNENRRLLEKSDRLQAIVASMEASGADQEQIKEVEEMMSTQETEQLGTLKQMLAKLEQSELQIDENVHLFQYYLDVVG